MSDFLIKNNSFKLLLRLWSHLNAHRKKQTLFLTILIVISALTEALSIGAIFPFLGAIANPEKLNGVPFFGSFLVRLGINLSDPPLLKMLLLFVFLAIFACLMRILVLRFGANVTFGIGKDLSESIFSKILHQDYKVHTSRNSSLVIDAISGKVNSVIYSSISPALIIVSSFAIFFSIIFILLTVNPLITFISFGLFSFAYSILILYIRKKILLNGRTIADKSTQTIKILQEGLGGIRDIILLGAQDIFCKKFLNANNALRDAQADNLFISQVPKYPMEAVGMLMIAGAAYFFSEQPGGIEDVLPMLALLALSAQRLLPVLQQAYGSWSNICGGEASLIDILDLLDQVENIDRGQITHSILPFSKEIQLDNIWFRYQDDQMWVLQGLNLTIKKGDRIGFIGETGSGKSTVIDIIMALLRPTKGSIFVDHTIINQSNSREWQVQIAHVPQEIFLVDGSVEQNIAYGVPEDKIDEALVRDAAARASIASDIQNWPNKYKTIVGERGSKLSGGQRQRIGIARALYRKASIIVMDEATSALDGATEKEVMGSIEGLKSDVTVLIIAHRLSTLKNCNRIFEIGKNGARQIEVKEDSYNGFNHR